MPEIEDDLCCATDPLFGVPLLSESWDAWKAWAKLEEIEPKRAEKHVPG